MDIFTFVTNGEDWDQDLFFVGKVGLVDKKLFDFELLFHFEMLFIGSRHRLSMIDTKLDFLAEKKTLHILDKRDFFEVLENIYHCKIFIVKITSPGG